ncbi:hypothetical protein HPB50_021466 [Hyalomma asiaticum]|uniref:Uncharacterized protein n=1 Tax=Hyalomma asiaticum TaxID=266040 RepID=A0ACB7RY82_HYAAI|nr:hypothetical protein HPB50_021466 [Hyalomma asiaticum]
MMRRCDFGNSAGFPPAAFRSLLGSTPRHFSSRSDVRGGGGGATVGVYGASEKRRQRPQTTAPRCDGRVRVVVACTSRPTRLFPDETLDVVRCN